MNCPHCNSKNLSAVYTDTDEWYKEIEDEEYENEYDYYDEDEVWYQRQEEMSKCVCGSYQWLERYKQFIKIADCICGF